MSLRKGCCPNRCPTLRQTRPNHAELSQLVSVQAIENTRPDFFRRVFKTAAFSQLGHSSVRHCTIRHTRRTRFPLLFLAGVVCLVVAHGLRIVGHPQLWACVQLFLREPQAISFASGLGNHLVRRILGPVFLPTIAGLDVMVACLASLGAPSTSVLERRVVWVRAEFAGHTRYCGSHRKDSVFSPLPYSRHARSRRATINGLVPTWFQNKAP